MDSRSGRADDRLGRHCPCLAGPHDPRRLDVVWCVPPVDRVRRAVHGLCTAAFGWHARSAVHQRDTVSGPGDPVLPPLRRCICDSAAVIVDRNQLYFPRCFGIAAAIGESNLPGRGWSVVLGVISVIAGLVVLAWPFDSIVVLVLVAGVWLVVLGVVQIIQSFQIRKDARTVREAIDSVSKRFTAR